MINAFGPAIKAIQYGRWDPKYPDAAQPRKPADQRVHSIEEGSDNPAWDTPPPSSHLERFSIVDYPEPKPFQRFKQPPTHRVIKVIFKAKGKWPRTEYWYWFTNFADANATYDLMDSTESPGEVVWAVMIRDLIPYRKIA